MKADRRAVLRLLGLGAAGGVLTASGLWTPTRTFFLPPPGGWPQPGISIRMLKDHDIINDLSPARQDMVHGWPEIRSGDIAATLEIFLKRRWCQDWSVRYRLADSPFVIGWPTD